MQSVNTTLNLSIVREPPRAEIDRRSNSAHVLSVGKLNGSDDTRVASIPRQFRALFRFRSESWGNVDLRLAPGPFWPRSIAEKSRAVNRLSATGLSKNPVERCQAAGSRFFRFNSETASHCPTLTGNNCNGTRSNNRNKGGSEERLLYILHLILRTGRLTLLECHVPLQ